MALRMMHGRMKLISMYLEPRVSLKSLCMMFSREYLIATYLEIWHDLSPFGVIYRGVYMIIAHLVLRSHGVNGVAVLRGVELGGG